MKTAKIAATLIGCTWLVVSVACGGPAEPASGASDVNASDAGAPSTASTDEPAPKWDSTSSAAAPADTSASGSGSTTGSPTTADTPTSPAQGPHRTDVYDKETTELALKRAAAQVKKNCGQAKNTDGKAVGPWGKTTMQVTLGHNGHSKGATIGPPFDGQPSGKCAVQAFALLSFPPWDGPDTTVPWDVEIPQPTK